MRILDVFHVFIILFVAQYKETYKQFPPHPRPPILHTVLVQSYT
jgi:hypothetical protein